MGRGHDIPGEKTLGAGKNLPVERKPGADGFDKEARNGAVAEQAQDLFRHGESGLGRDIAGIDRDSKRVDIRLRQQDEQSQPVIDIPIPHSCRRIAIDEDLLLVIKGTLAYIRVTR